MANVFVYDVCVAVVAGIFSLSPNVFANFFSHKFYSNNYCIPVVVKQVNPLITTLKPQSNGPSYSNTVIGTLVVDGWAATFGTARRGLGAAAARPGPSSLYQV